MSRVVIGRDYHRPARTFRTCREAFGSDLERSERWNRQWDRLIVGFCLLLAVTVVPLIALGKL